MAYMDAMNREISIDTSSIRKLFVTHLHGDHIFGLPPLLCQMSNSDLPNIDIFGPVDLGRFLYGSLRLNSNRQSKNSSRQNKNSNRQNKNSNRQNKNSNRQNKNSNRQSNHLNRHIKNSNKQKLRSNICF